MYPAYARETAVDQGNTAGHAPTSRRGAFGSGTPAETDRRRSIGGVPESAASVPALDDLSRDVYCVMGIPVDATDMLTVLRHVEIAASRKVPFLISTPNLNFLVASLSDADFRESLIASDLCTADGMPIIWIARLLGIPVKRRIAGSDFLEALRPRARPEKPLRIFLFGGGEGVAAAASQVVNARAGGLRCVGSLSPGFGSVEELSDNHLIEAINASDADFLIIALGARKGQSWLMRNHHRLRVPVRAHLGATLNFQAGTIRRAPPGVQKAGFEWLWRIVQEPRLWRRYWADGRVLIGLLAGRVLPLVIWRQWHALRGLFSTAEFDIHQGQDTSLATVRLSGAATAAHFNEIVQVFGRALETGKVIAIDLSRVTNIDARILGLILALRKAAAKGGRSVELRDPSPQAARLIRLNCVDYLVSRDEPSATMGGQPIYG